METNKIMNLKIDVLQQSKCICITQHH